MGKGNYLGGFEGEVLLGVAAAGDEAHARTIYGHLVRAAERDISITAVHVTLARLVKKGHLTARMGLAADTNDERARKLYALTASGATALRTSRAAYEKLWVAASSHPALR